MKILFLMDSPEYLRFYDSAILEMAARGHAVRIAVNNQSAKKPVGMEGLGGYGDRVTVLGLVPQRGGFWHEAAHALRAVMDFVRFLHPDYAQAPTLRARIKRKVLPRAYRWLDRIQTLPAHTVARIERALMAAHQALPVPSAIAELLRVEAPDVLLVSPLVAAASEQVDWIQAARVAGIRTAVAVASWDNLTNKGLLRIQPDRILVWNERQRREAIDYHYVDGASVRLTGAQVFDKWFGRRVTVDRETFCRQAGLPGTGPFVVFTGSSSFISETNAEVAFVRRWIAAIRAHPSPALRDVQILVRPHPYNFHRWGENPVADLPGVTVFPKATYNPVEESSRDVFFDTMTHGAAIVGINTSAMIEAAIAGRPVCSILAEEFSGSQEGTIHFRHLLPENGGFVRLARDLDEHVAQLAECLEHPEVTARETAGFVASFVRPQGVDQPSTPVFVDAIEDLAASPVSPAATPFAPRLLAPPLLAAGVLPVLVVDRLGDPATWTRLRKKTVGQVREARKSLEKALHRAMKRAGLRRRAR